MEAATSSCRRHGVGNLNGPEDLVFFFKRVQTLKTETYQLTDMMVEEIQEKHQNKHKQFNEV